MSTEERDKVDRVKKDYLDDEAANMTSSARTDSQVNSNSSKLSKMVLVNHPESSDDLFSMKDPTSGIKSGMLGSNNSQKRGIFYMPETSPTKYNFANVGSLLISPIVENNRDNMILTPQQGCLNEDIDPITARTPLNMKLSPFQENIISGLKHDENFSSFKRIGFDNFNFNPSILSRSINFDSTGAGINDVEYFSKKQEYFNKNFGFTMTQKNVRSMTKNPYLLNCQKQLFNYNSNVNFSSDSCSDYSEEEVEGVEGEEINIRRNSSSAQSHTHTTKKFCCTCTKSRCLKKYCECFANNEYCQGCECSNCLNIPKCKEIIRKSVSNSLNANYKRKDSSSNVEDVLRENEDKVETICNCTKSNCMKKYCECFKAGEGCKDNCRCVNCENNKKTKKRIPTFVSEEEKERRKERKNPLNFIIEGTSVYIHNEDISITQRKETPQKEAKKDVYIPNDKIVISNESKDDSNVTDEAQDNYAMLKKNIFVVNSTQEVNIKPSNSHETPKQVSRKRRRNNSKDDSLAKSSSTHFQTPLFTTTSQKTVENNKINIDLDTKIVKNLDKIY